MATCENLELIAMTPCINRGIYPKTKSIVASEFMHHCGVGTTRALSLVASETDTVMRPWYSQKAREVKIPEVDNVPVQFRKMLVAQYLERFKQPDVMRYVIVKTFMKPSIRYVHMLTFM